MKILIIIVIAIISIIIIGAGIYSVKVYKNTKALEEKHFCNYCKAMFVASIEKLNYKYCPYCGRELDYHEKYKEKQNEE